MIDNNLSIVLIGAGNVATHMAKAMHAAGLAVLQVWSRTMASAQRVAGMIGCEAVCDYDRLRTDADVYIVSVKDDALPGVIANVCARCPGAVFLHTAGTMSMRLFEGHARHYGVVYPMQTFSKDKPLDFKQIPVFVEAVDERALAVARRVANALSCNVHDLPEQDRKWLHVAAVFACNFSNACYAMAERLLRQHGLDFSVMLPLVDETARKVHSLSPEAAQTGPAVRHDHVVMGEHMSMLGGQDDLRTVYRLMSDFIENTHKQ